MSSYSIRAATLATFVLSMSNGVALAQESAAAALPVHPAGIRFAQGPANGAQVAIETLKSAPRTPGSTPLPASLEARPPLPMNPLVTQAVADGGSMESVSFADTWYYVLERRGKPVGCVILQKDGGRLRMNSAHREGRLLDVIAPPVEKLLRDPRSRRITFMRLTSSCENWRRSSGNN